MLRYVFSEARNSIYNYAHIFVYLIPANTITDDLTVIVFINNINTHIYII